MNILFVNTRYNGGGAEKIARQLFLFAKEQYDTNSYFLAGRGGKDDAIDCVYENNGILNISNKVINFLTDNARKKDLRFRRKIISMIQQYGIDIVHFHNIHGNYMGMEDVNEIAKYCKVVWTLHDMWALTGHCAYPFQCDKWRIALCKTCLNKELYPKMWIDRAENIYKLKSKIFTKGNITYVVPSQWLFQKCNQSYLAQERKELIYNGVNTKIFYPINKVEMREKYKISEQKLVLMFASGNLDNPYKGADVLVKALNAIKKKSEYELIIIGNGDQLPLDKSFKCHYMGYISSDQKMNELYNLSDVFILPSKAENFPCAVLESMAAGTPVIGSRVGGIPEQIDEKTGWLFEVNNSNELSQLISRLPEEMGNLQQMGLECRKTVETKYSEEKMLENYFKLYSYINQNG